ncbi:MAG: hypothetical protein R2883_06160 [Caldisericia bacterium]
MLRDGIQRAERSKTMKKIAVFALVFVFALSLVAASLALAGTYG